MLSDEFQKTISHYRKNYQKGYVFNQYENKHVYLLSSMEFKYVKYLEQNNIKWIKPKPLEYFSKEKKHLYFPDFYLPETNEYIEIKGYMWKGDKLKMKNVLLNNPEITLKIIDKIQLKLLMVT